jgi:hypothetical protein
MTSRCRACSARIRVPPRREPKRLAVKLRAHQLRLGCLDEQRLAPIPRRANNHARQAVRGRCARSSIARSRHVESSARNHRRVTRPIVASSGVQSERRVSPRPAGACSRSSGAPPCQSPSSSRWHTFGTRERKNLSHPPDSNRRPADYESALAFGSGPVRHSQVAPVLPRTLERLSTATAVPSHRVLS